MGLSDLADPSGGWSLEPAVLDSRRFGIRVARLTVRRGPAVAAELSAAVRDDDATVIVARYPTEQTWVAAALAASGRSLLPTGGLLYWEAPVLEDSGRPLAPGVDVLPAADTADDVPALVEGMVRDIFTDYATHYRFNSMFDPQAILDGYVEWASSCLDDPGCSILVVRHKGSPVGIATLGWDGPVRDVLLAGIRPSHQGRGHYTALLEACRADALSEGAQRLVISTQSHNVRVQRAWARAGWRPIDAFETVHLLGSDSREGRRPWR